MLKKILSVLGVAVLVASMVVFGFHTKAVQAETQPQKPNYLAQGGFTSWFFSATTSIPYFESGQVSADPAVLSVTDANKPTAGTILDGFSVWAGTAGFTASIYDSATIQGVSTAALSRLNYIDEIGQATQYNNSYSDWISQRKLNSGLVIITDRAPGVVTIYRE